MLQPWARKTVKQEPVVPLSLEYNFNVDELPRSPVHLVLEAPGRFQISLNGISISSDTENGWWVDPCLRRIPIDPANLRLGSNELSLSLQFNQKDHLETLFLTGYFGVRISGTECKITAPPSSIRFGNWLAQGLPFYGGAVTYRFRARPTPRKGECVVLSAPHFKGALVRVLVDGNHAGYLPWPPYELDITSFLTEKEIEIGLEVFGSRRNCFGPLHLNDKKPRWVGPQEYRTSGERWVDDYQLVPCGLTKSPVLSYRKKQESLQDLERKRK